MRNYLWAAVTAALLATPQVAQSFAPFSAPEIYPRSPAQLGSCAVSYGDCLS
jgi:hypothetical protein